MVGNRNVTIDRRFWGVLGTVFILFIFWKGSISQSASMHETVLLTGGLGFIGSHLVDELLVRGYTVVIFDDKSTGHNFNPEAITIIGDITKVNDFDLIKYKVDYIVHFAAAISVAESMVDPAKYERINVEGSRNVFEWGANHNVKKLFLHHLHLFMEFQRYCHFLKMHQQHQFQSMHLVNLLWNNFKKIAMIITK